MKGYGHTLYAKGAHLNAANEIEDSCRARLRNELQRKRKFESVQYWRLCTTSRSPRRIRCRTLLDTTAEVQRLHGIPETKYHPTWRQSQFEIITATVKCFRAAQIQLYKLICRQVATNMGFINRLLLPETGSE